MEANRNDQSSAFELNRLQVIEQELIARLRQQAAVMDLGQRALASKDLQSLFDEATRLVADVLQVEFCKVLELEPDGKTLRLKSGVGWKEGYVGKASVGVGVDTQAGFALIANEPVIVANIHTDTRFTSPTMLWDHGVISGMSVVIQGKEGPYGVLGAHTHQKRNFTVDDANFLQSVANVLASSIERLRAEAEVQRSRDQFAVILKNIADGVTAQDLTGKLVYANEAAARVIGYDSAEELLRAPLPEVMERFNLLDEKGEPLPLDELPGRRALRGEATPSTTVRYRLKNTGEEHWSLVKARPVFGPSGQIEMVVNIFQDVTELKRTDRDHRILAGVGNLLSASLDYDVTLRKVAQIIVPDLADWCAVDILEEDEKIRRLGIAHVDPEKLAIAQEINDKYPQDLNADYGVPKVLQTGKIEFYPEINAEQLERSAQDDRHRFLLQSLGPRSAAIIPLVARGRTLGALTLAWAESGRRYTEADIQLAKELALRAALAIDNARLYQSAQTLNADLEARVSKRTAQLQAAVNKLRSEISDRRRAEEAQRESEKLLASLFESAPDATVLVDQQGQIVRVNTQTELMFGYTRDELIGQTIDILLPERLRNRHTQMRMNYTHMPVLRPMGAGLELFGRRKDGTELPIDIMLSPIETQHGHLVIAAVRDIRERKQMQAELAEVQRSLIESLEAERLHIAQELHDGPMQELYGISYQLKMLAQSLTSAEDKLECQQSIETLQVVIQSMRSLSGELRPPALAPFGLEKAIHAHIAPVREAHPELEIFMDLDPDGQLLAERVRLALFRIYQHAVSNVLRHASASRLEIRFRLLGESAQLEIQDDGCGFELPARWVELARQGHLGLVGTAERVQAVGGQFKITTAPGKGTLIQVTVPTNGERLLPFAYNNMGTGPNEIHSAHSS